MSDEKITTPEEKITTPEEEVELSEILFTKKPKKEKNPNRVKTGFKVGAIGQQRKEQLMRERVKKEMYKPTTWIVVGIVLTSVGFVGLYFSPLFAKKKKNVVTPQKREEKPERFFG